MQAHDFTHDEIVEFAAQLYGDNWRNGLAENLGITRKQLVITLAAGDPVPTSITVPFRLLIEDHLLKQAENLQKMEARLHEICGVTPNSTQPI